MSVHQNAARGETVVEDLGAIPAFTSEDEEFEYWATHSLGDRVLRDGGPLPTEILPLQPTQTVSLRLDDDVVNRLKTLARYQHKRYHALLREFIVERLSEEERHRGLGAGTSSADRVPGHSAQAPTRH